MISWFKRKFSIETKGDFFALTKQFFKFGVVGLGNTLISLVIYYLVIWINSGWYMTGNVLGWIVGVANSFFWNHRYVFTSGSGGKKALFVRLCKTYLCYGLSLAVSSVMLHFELSRWGVSQWLAPLLNMILTVPLNFLMNKLWVFK